MTNKEFATVIAELERRVLATEQQLLLALGRLDAIQEHNERHRCKTCQYESSQKVVQAAAAGAAAVKAKVHDQSLRLAHVFAGRERYVQLRLGPAAMERNLLAVHSSLGKVSKLETHTMPTAEWRALVKQDEYLQQQVAAGLLAVEALTAEQHLQLGQQKVQGLSPAERSHWIKKELGEQAVM